jgi:DNA-binding transcriptional MerR regulator/effector-binding domain-containing protein
LRTGAFARAASLSVKALRVYHEMGLLVPSVVDPETGYRAYSPAQLTDAAIIRLLREVGVPLQDIRGVLEGRDLGLVRKVLAEQAQRFQAGLDAVTRMVDDLSVDEEPDLGGVALRREPPRVVLAIDGSPLISDLGAFVRRSARTLAEAAAASGAVVESCLGASYPPAIEEDRQEVTVFVAVSNPVLVPAESRVAGVRLDELPGCEVAVLEHRGPYSGLESCYRRLGTWVAFHAAPTDEAVREWYLIPPDGPEGDAVTELLWPVVGDPPAGRNG